jgi:hypothetical protein
MRVRWLIDEMGHELPTFQYDPYLLDYYHRPVFWIGIAVMLMLMVVAGTEKRSACGKTWAAVARSWALLYFGAAGGVMAVTSLMVFCVVIDGGGLKAIDFEKCSDRQLHWLLEIAFSWSLGAMGIGLARLVRILRQGRREGRAAKPKCGVVARLGRILHQAPGEEKGSKEKCSVFTWRAFLALTALGVSALFIATHWPRRPFEGQVVMALLRCGPAGESGAAAFWGVTNVGRVAVTVDRPEVQVLRLKRDDWPRLLLGTIPFRRTTLNPGESMKIRAWVPAEPGRWRLAVRLEPEETGWRGVRAWLTSALWRVDAVRGILSAWKEDEVVPAFSPWLEPPSATAKPIRPP